MYEETNLLRARAKRFAAPVLALGLVLFTGAFVFGHKHVDAATAPDNPIAPINNASIDPLLALDQATEAVASRVTPAVVNIAVTSHRTEQPAAEEEGGGSDGDNPFSQFFGPVVKDSAPDPASSSATVCRAWGAANGRLSMALAAV